MNSREKKIDSLIHGFRSYLEQLQEDKVEYVISFGRKPEENEPRAERKVKLENKMAKPTLGSPPVRLKALEEEVGRCRRCRLGDLRKNAVFGEGGIKRGVMFIGEGPGQNEDLQGRPFVGRAGKLLDKILASIGLKRKDVFITNIIKCRPPGNRDPKPDEVIACWPYLEEQIEMLKPRVIVTLGSPASKTLLDTSQGISRLRGRFHDYQGIPLLPTYHPAYLLRSYTLENRNKVWEDMKMLKEFLD